MADPVSGRGVLAGSTLLYHDLSLPEALQLLAEDGFQTVDIVSIPGERPHLDPYRDGFLASAELREVEDTLLALGQRVHTVYVFPGSLHHPESGSGPRIVGNTLRLAQRLGAPSVGLPSGPPTYPGRLAEDAAAAAARLRGWAERAEDAGVALSVEAPHAETLASTFEGAVLLFGLLDDPRVRITLDCSHLWVSGARDFAAVVAGLRGVPIGGVHLRDATATSVTLTPGTGDVPFGAFVAAARRAGFDGPFALELEYRFLSLARRRRELAAAREHLLPVVEGRPTPERRRPAPALRAVRRGLADPLEEVARHPRLVPLAKQARAVGRRVLPLPAQVGGWTTRRYLGGRDEVRALRAGSVALGGRPDRPVRAGVVGCGHAGTLHGLGYRALRDVEVVGVCDVLPERALALARRLGCPVAEAPTDLIAAGADVVSVCTREWQHVEPIRELLQNGVDVFSEKVLATRVRHARELVRLAAGEGRTLGVDYNYRYLAGVAELKRLLDAGRLGALQLLRIGVHAFSYHHALDLLWHLGGRVTSVQAAVRTADARRPFGGTDWALYDADLAYVPNAAALSVELASGALGAVTAVYDVPEEAFLLEIEALGDRGAALLAGVNAFDGVGRLSVLEAGRGRRLPARRFARPPAGRGFEHSFFEALRRFVDAHVTGREAPTPGAWGLALLELEAAIGRSARTGERVALGDAVDPAPAALDPLP